MGKYLDVGSSFKKWKKEDGFFNTALNTGEILAKSVGNIGIFAVTTALPAVLDITSSLIENNGNLNSQQKDVIRNNRAAAEKLRSYKKDE